MEINIAGKTRTICKVKPHELDAILETGENILIYGASGHRKNCES